MFILGDVRITPESGVLVPGSAQAQATVPDVAGSLPDGASRGRYEQVIKLNGVVDKTKVYVGGIYEEETKVGTTKNIHYIRGGEGTVAIYTTETGQSDKTRYLHKDHLGSIQTISDELGNVVEVLSFDAWGKRRNAADWSAASGVITSAETDRGFTGHEMLDAVDLVHMNGRVYDPVVGRFLSADPNIQAPENPQSLNRYSYVLNNPLSFTDPSGFFFKKIFKAVAKFVKKHKAIIVAAAVFLATSGWASGIAWSAVGGTVGPLTATQALAASVIGGAIQGSLAAISGTAISGGSFSDILTAGVTGGLFGGVSAGIATGIGNQFGHQSVLGTAQHVKKIVAHGTSGGLSSLAQGGKFQHGFISNGFLESVAPGISGLKRKGFSPTLRLATATVVGGTASELGGGKFANGAVTAAFTWLYNQEGGKREDVEKVSSEELGFKERIQRVIDGLVYPTLPSRIEQSNCIYDSHRCNIGDEIRKFDEKVPDENALQNKNFDAVQASTEVISIAVHFTSGAVKGSISFLTEQVAKFFNSKEVDAKK